MYKKTIKTENIQTLGNYTIVKSVEQTYWDNGKRFGGADVWYDICLDGGNGDILESYCRLQDARKRIKELDVHDKKTQCMQVDFANSPKNGMGSLEKIIAFYDGISAKTLYKIYEEYFGKEN